MKAMQAQALKQAIETLEAMEAMEAMEALEALEALDALEALMDWPDVDLADWLTGRRPMPDDAPPMLVRIRKAVAGCGFAWAIASRPLPP